MDEGYRLLQARSLHNSIAFPVILDYPGGHLLGSSADEARPVPAHFGCLRENGLFSYYNPGTALLSSPFHGRGFLLPTLISGFILWFLLWRKLTEKGFQPLSAAAIPLVCTPVLYFSLGMWSYPLSIALVFLAVESAEKNKAAAAFLMTGAAALFRTEFAVGFLLVFLTLDGKWYRKIHPALPALVILLLGNWFFSGGDIMGSHLLSGVKEQALYSADSGNASMIQLKMAACGKALLSVVPGKSGGLWLVPGAVLWGLWSLALGNGKAGTTASAAGMLICLGACLFWAVRGYPFLDGFTMKHPLLVFPVLWLFDGDMLKKSRRELLIFGILLILLLPMHTEGPAWGVRHLFLPFFLMLRHLKPGKIKMYRILGPAVLITASALLFLGINRARVTELNSTAETNGDCMITTNWILPGWLTDSMAAGKPVVYAGTAGLLTETLNALNHMDPVVICLGRDALLTAEFLRDYDDRFRVCGEVSFGKSLSCVLFSRDIQRDLLPPDTSH